ncbi:MAG: ABC transporter permease subunit [Bacteroidetes bacterium]|nr:ABC transporter permease subunit [Bacteroidota bacterium]
MNSLTLFNSFKAESIKIKHSPISWLTLISGALTAMLVTVLFLMRGIDPVEAGINPWDGYFSLCFSIFSALVLIPFVVLIVNALVQIENKANSWKQLYSLPIARGNIYFSKLILLLLFLISLYLIFAFSIIPVAWLTGIFRPEYAFQDYSPAFWPLAQRLAHSFIALLGLTAFHYWLAYRWKNIIPSIGIGFLGFVLAPLVLEKPALAAFIPHSHVSWLSTEMSKGNISVLSQPEMYSLLFFVTFICLGYYQEKHRNIY